MKILYFEGEESFPLWGRVELHFGEKLSLGKDAL